MKEENDMNLPEHYTAVDCVHFKKCQRTFGCKAENTQCDFSPSSFHPIFESEARVRGYVKADMESQAKPSGKPKIVCLCGSTRFTPQMMYLEWQYAKNGILALGWFVRPLKKGETEKDHLAEKEGCQELFDELHKRKIDLCDSVMVLNIGGYIGESTRSEIEYAKAHSKPIQYLETISDTGEKRC